MYVENCNCKRGTYDSPEVEPLTIPVMNFAQDAKDARTNSFEGRSGANNSPTEALVAPVMVFGKEQRP